MKGYTSRDVAKLLGLTVAQVRGFARDGFLTPGRGPRGELLFSFQDLVILRTAKGLVAARIPTRRIRRALRRLRTELPRGRSLAELRITAEDDRIVVSDGESTWSPESDQMQLDFAISDLATRAAPMARRAARAARLVELDLSAQDWYDLGLELEVAAPIATDPRLADAHYNVARLYEKAGKKAAALRHLSSYRRLTGDE